jgi:2-keto-4-pentenoate hydratase/2-oxohepta-3-ene-1,7-dioic acid hydratase in catechol pathway
MVTADEIPDPTRLELSTRVNGIVLQQGNLCDLIFRIEELISYISCFTELSPGDVIVTGTPEGVGAQRRPPIWLQPGDVVEVEIDGIGTLKNNIVQE